MLLTIYNDDKSSGGSIAYQQPTNGSFIWNTKTVCNKEIQTSTRQCHDLLAGYYWIGLAVEAYGGDMMHAPMASSAPFQILAQQGAGQSAEVTSNRVKGFIVAGSVASDKFFWLQTAASGKRLICLSPATALDIPWRLPTSPPLFFTASDLPWGTPIEATGVWENAHSLGCSGTGTDPDAPPRVS